MSWRPPSRASAWIGIGTKSNVGRLTSSRRRLLEGEGDMQRMGQVLGLKPEKVKEYVRLHADVWPEILEMISACNIKNYSIYLKEPENLLFAYYEYHGTDYAA